MRMIDTDPLYDSAKDEQPEPMSPVEFTPVNPVEYTLSEPVKPQVSAFTPQTIIPDQTRIIPDVAIPVQEQSISVDPERMLKYFSEPVGRQVIDDIQKGRPLMPKIAEILVRKNIVRENTISEVQPATVEVIPNKNPLTIVSNPEADKKKKLSLIDKFVNVIYNLIY